VGEGGDISQVSGVEYVRDEEEKKVGVGSERNNSPGAVEVTGFPPRPFLLEHIYLSTTIPSRNRDKQLAFIRHYCYL